MLSKKSFLFIKYTVIIFLCVIFFFLLLIIIFLYIHPRNVPITPPPVTKDFNVTKEKETWKKYIKEVGSQKAYQNFKAKYASLPYNIRHLGIHTFGELLYEIDGIHGLPTCDKSFGFGCYHGFFGKAIQDTGITKIKEMDAACIERFGLYGTGCQHGIGHGIMSYVGNDKLVDALKICDTLQWKGKIGGCRGGVFMEYNSNTITHTEKPKPRELNPAFPYLPCTDLQDTYQHECYYTLPAWWHRVYTADYKKIGELCDQAPSEKKEICFLGTGVAAGEFSYFMIEDTLQKCNIMPSDFSNMLCKAGATWVYKASKQHLENIHIFCDSVNPSLQTICQEKSQIIQ